MVPNIWDDNHARLIELGRLIARLNSLKLIHERCDHGLSLYLYLMHYTRNPIIFL